MLLKLKLCRFPVGRLSRGRHRGAIARSVLTLIRFSLQEALLTEFSPSISRSIRMAAEQSVAHSQKSFNPRDAFKAPDRMPQ
jgi:hypothetical protein